MRCHPVADSIFAANALFDVAVPAVAQHLDIIKVHSRVKSLETSLPASSDLLHTHLDLTGMRFNLL